MARLARRSLAASRLGAVAGLLACAALPGTASAQDVDCGRLQQQIAQLGRGGGGSRAAGSARRLTGDLARTQAYAHQLGCDGFTFFGANPACGGLNNRIAQLQANLARIQAGGGGGGLRENLIARYNASCANGQPRQRGFFESLFGGPEQRQPPLPELPVEEKRGGPGDDEGPRGPARSGSQAVCVRTCDGGFFPLGVSARRDEASLNEMCQSLCPGTDTAVFTRNPDNDIKTAVGLDGKPYMDLPNALKFQKTVTPACSCRPAGKSWAETLANAEQVLDNVRKGDVIVTKEKSDQLSRPNLDAKTRAAILAAAPPDKADPDQANSTKARPDKAAAERSRPAMGDPDADDARADGGRAMDDADDGLGDDFAARRFGRSGGPRP